ncbi:C39 family peptidase [Eubacterium ruminantium]|uniref:C39 family peptidase n=1 Tax=Eubacterium ruminantium TaxID=42322 RepID=UPI0024799473|nr:C39 family peptidase [Eubacterium ruminantium]
MSKFENNNGQNSNPLYYESNYGVDEKGQDIEMGQMVMGVTGTTGGRGSNPQTPSGDSRAPERKVEPRRNPKNPEQRRPVRANGKGVPQKAPQNVRPRTEMKTAGRVPVAGNAAGERPVRKQAPRPNEGQPRRSNQANPSVNRKPQDVRREAAASRSGKNTKDNKKSSSNNSKLLLTIAIGLMVVNAVFLAVNITAYKNNATEKKTIQRQYSEKEADLVVRETDVSERDKELSSLSEELEQYNTEDELRSSIKSEFSDLSEEDLKKVFEIYGNLSKYPEDLIRLLHKNHETLNYVYDYPANGQKPVNNDISAEMKDVEAGKVPLFLQWDERWGYMKYGDGYMSNNGCGPTSLSMVVVYLTGDSDYTPAKIAEFAEESNLYVDGAGTAWSLLSEKCTVFGVYAEEVGLDEDAMAEAVTNGHPIVACVGEGDFTTGGHFIVITGYKDGKFTVNDPNSVIRTNKTWDFDTLSKQIDGIWAYYKY